MTAKIKPRSGKVFVRWIVNQKTFKGHWKAIRMATVEELDQDVYEMDPRDLEAWN